MQEPQEEASPINGNKLQTQKKVDRHWYDGLQLKQIYKKIFPEVIHNHMNSVFLGYIEPLTTTIIKLSENLWRFQTQNLYQKYKYNSLAIISSCRDLQKAKQRSNEYNIPLMYLQIIDETEQSLVWNKLLNVFEIGQFLNQNFLLNGKITKKLGITAQPSLIQREQNFQNTEGNPKKIEGSKQNQYGQIIFYKGGQVYLRHRIIDCLLMKSQTEIKETLQQARNMFYENSDADAKMGDSDKVDINAVQQMQLESHNGYKQMRWGYEQNDERDLSQQNDERDLSNNAKDSSNDDRGFEQNDRNLDDRQPRVNFKEEQ